MSELTQCCRCTLIQLQHKYGAENIRTRTDDPKWPGGIAVDRRLADGTWKTFAWFGALTTECVC